MTLFNTLALAAALLAPLGAQAGYRDFPAAPATRAWMTASGSFGDAPANDDVPRAHMIKVAFNDAPAPITAPQDRDDVVFSDARMDGGDAQLDALDAPALPDGFNPAAGGRPRKDGELAGNPNWSAIAAPVPEPASYMLLLVGVAILSMAVRRRTRA